MDKKTLDEKALDENWTPASQYMFREPRLITTDVGAQQLPQTKTPYEPEKNIEENVREKNKMKTTGGRKLRIVYVCKSKMAL